VTRRGTGHVALLAALFMAAAGGLDKAAYSQDGPRDPENWKRKKWQKGASGGPGGPAVRLKIPGRGRR